MAELKSHFNRIELHDGTRVAIMIIENIILLMCLLKYIRSDLKFRN